MAETLYRKYRPHTFADVVNQRHIRVTIQHALEQERVAHAYLFSGPRGVGKTTMARLLARAVNCTKPGKEGEPCGQCDFCQAMTKGQAIDIIEIDAASQTGVDNVRENIIQNARVAPTSAKMKVFIIDEVHMLSLAAFNALLKLLEEPPSHAMFILATTEIHRVPDTIISRTQRFDFKRLTVRDMADRLERLAQAEKRTLGDGVAERIARAAGGSMRDAESMLGQLFSFGDKTIDADIADLVLPRSNRASVIAVLTAVIANQARSALDTFHEYCDEGGDIPAFVHDLVGTARIAMLLAIDPTMVDQYRESEEPEQLNQVLELAKQASAERHVQIVETFVQAERQLYRGALLELPVEIAIVQLTLTAGDDEPPTSPTTPKAPTAPSHTKIAKSSKKKGESGTLDLATAQEAWQTVQKQLRGQPSLKLSVQMAQVSGVEGQTIELAVPFVLHQQRLSDPKNQTALIELLNKELGRKVQLAVTITDTVPDLPPAPEEPAPPPVAPAKPKNTPVTGDDLWDQVVSSFQTEG